MCVIVCFENCELFWFVYAIFFLEISIYKSDTELT